MGIRSNVWYLKYYDIPLCLARKVPIHSDDKEEFAELDWVVAFAKKQGVVIDITQLSVHKMNGNVFHSKGTWPT